MHKKVHQNIIFSIQKVKRNKLSASDHSLSCAKGHDHACGKGHDHAEQQPAQNMMVEAPQRKSIVTLHKVSNKNHNQ